MDSGPQWRKEGVDTYQTQTISFRFSTTMHTFKQILEVNTGKWNADTRESCVVRDYHNRHG